MSPVHSLGCLHALNDAGEVEETFLSHEHLLVALDCCEGLCDRESNVKTYGVVWCDVLWLLVTVSWVII